jgi:hypothetical protein
MAGKRGPESFAKRQRERQKQQKQLEKSTRRRERNSAKKDARLTAQASPGSLNLLPLGIVEPRGAAPTGQR